MKSFFRKFSQADVPESNFWIALKSEDQLHDLLEKSTTRTQIVFKHSTRCGISRMVIRQFEKQASEVSETMDFYYLDLLAYRALSDQLATQLKVLHQSPQLIVIRNSEVLVHESHGAINDLNLKRFE